MKNQKITQLKRQSAWATLESILTEDQLFQAIKLLEVNHQRNDMASLVSYINLVGKTFNIDSSVCKKLYPKYYNYLNTRGIKLPEDPLLRIKTLEKQKVLSNESVVVSEPKNVTFNSDSTDERDEDSSMSVFIYFIDCLLSRFSMDTEILLEDAIVFIEKDTTIYDIEKEEIMEWLKHPEEYQWVFAIEEKSMVTVIHLFYMALCDFIGPLDADILLQEVLAECQMLPAADKFSPNRLL